MKSKFSVLALLLCSAAAVVGCSSTVGVRDISGIPKKSAETIEGVPMQFAGRHQLTVFAKQPDGSYKKVHELVYAMPDQSRLFAVNVDSKMLANHTLTLALYDDGTPKTVGLITSSQAQAALTQLGTSAAAMATSAATYDQQRQAAAKAALDTQKGLLDSQKDVLSSKQALQTLQSGSAERDAMLLARETKILAYRDALDAVTVQQAKVDELSADATKEDQAKAETSLRQLKLKANQAARALRVKVPYPEADMPF